MRRIEQEVLSFVRMYRRHHSIMCNIYVTGYWIFLWGPDGPGCFGMFV